MDWALPYTPEQEEFRKEVRTWLGENIPEEMKDPVDARDFSKEHYLFWREKHRDMAAKGWLYPTFPKAYGGGGLSGDHETILDEEFSNARVVRAMNNQTGFPALLVWTTDEQKEKFLAPILRGEKIMWQKYTEPRSGADLASYTSRAVRDGDDWLLTGQNVFISGKPRPEWDAEGPDYLFGPMVTDDDAPRHRNMGYFMIPMPSEGLEVREMELLVGHDQHAIFMDNVRVPGDHLIGGDHQGWQVANTGLEQEHGGRGRAFPRDEVVDNLVAYTRETERDGCVSGQRPGDAADDDGQRHRRPRAEPPAAAHLLDVHKPDGGAVPGQPVQRPRQRLPACVSPSGSGTSWECTPWLTGTSLGCPSAGPRR